MPPALPPHHHRLYDHHCNHDNETADADGEEGEDEEDNDSGGDPDDECDDDCDVLTERATPDPAATSASTPPPLQGHRA